MVDYYILLTTTRRPRLTAKLVYFPTWKCLRIFRVPNENLSVQNPLRKIVESKLGLSTQKWILEFYPESIEGTANCLSFVNPTDGETKRINLGIFRAKLLWVLLLHTWREGGKKGQITIPLLTYFGIEKSEQKMGWTTTTTVKRTLWLFHTFKTWREFWSKLIVAAVVVLRKNPLLNTCSQSQLQNCRLPRNQSNRQSIFW